MPAFDDSATTAAPVEDVWKLLYDPTRIPEWWPGVATVTDASTDGFTLFPDGYPDFPMPHAMRSDGRGVTISCLTSDLVFEWRLQELGDGTRIAVHVELPEREAHRLDGQRDAMSQAVRSLAALAEADPTGAPPARC